MYKILAYLTFFLVLVIGAETITLKYIDSLSFSGVSQSAPSSYDYWLKKKPIMTKSIKIDISEGVITGIDSKGGYSDVNGVNYAYALKIDIRNNREKSYTFIYDRNDLEKTIIRSSKSAHLKAGDLTIGDSIVIKETTDLLRTKNSIVSVEITKK